MPRPSMGAHLYINAAAIEALEQLDQLLVDALEQAGLFLAGARPEAPGARSVLGRHFVRTNVARYGWPPLSERYAARKKKKYGNKPVLVATGAMRDAFLGKVTVKATRDRAHLDFVVPKYAKYHQHGGAVSGRPPRRAPLSTNPQDRKAVKAFMEKFIGSHLAAALRGQAAVAIA